jgi:hypothetical protein
MSIYLPTNLHEKMECAISQYIEELSLAGIIEEVAGIIEAGRENYELNENNDYYLYIINLLFDDSLPKYNKVRMFNKIQNNYFTKEDKNELKKCVDDYLITITNNRRRNNWLNSFRHNFMFTLACIFTRTNTNKNFIIEQIECVCMPLVILK